MICFCSIWRVLEYLKLNHYALAILNEYIYDLACLLQKSIIAFLPKVVFPIINIEVEHMSVTNYFETDIRKFLG